MIILSCDHAGYDAMQKIMHFFDNKKIEYKYINKKQDINIDFLLGFQEDSWKLWIGRIGSCSYDDDPYKSFETKDFADAIIKCLDEVQNFLKKVEDDPQNYIQFYKNL